MTAPSTAATETPDRGPSRAWSQLGWLWVSFGALSFPAAIIGIVTLKPNTVEEGAWLLGLLTIGGIFTLLFIAAGLLLLLNRRWVRRFGVVASCIAFPLGVVLVLYGMVGSTAVIVWGAATIGVVGLSIKGIVERTRYLQSKSETQRVPPVRRRDDVVVFISYRRTDSADTTDRLCEHLMSRFVETNVFRDIHSIPPGVDFREHIDAAIARCDVLIAVIGPRWLEAPTPKGGRRIDDATDFVRLEIEAALRRKLPVIPILVQNASMPAATTLPGELRQLAFRNALLIRSDPDFRNDIERLFAALDAIEPRVHDGQLVRS